MAKLLTGTRIYGTGTVDTQLFVSGTNSATSTTTGALQVVGGVGIGGNLYVGGTIYGATLSGTATTATNADNIKTVSQTSSSNYYPVFVDSNNSTAAYEALYTTSSFVISPQSGRVGIGTSSPSTNLTIGSTAASGGAGGGLGVFLSRGVTTNFFEAFDGTKSYIAGVDNTQSFAKAGTLSGHDLAIVTGNGSKIYVQNSTGNVGIGTITPLATLEVSSTASTSIKITTSGANTLFRGYEIGATTGDSGVYGSIKMEVQGGELRFTAGYATWGGYQTFFANGSERLRITSNGGIAFGGSTNYGSSGQILQSNGNAAPTWISTGSLTAASANTATHLAGGVAGQIPYQTAPGVTSFLSTGTAGNVLVSNGSSAPTYNNTLTLTGTTAATSTTTGALQVVGGFGLGGDLFIRGDIATNDTTFNLINATATTVNFAGAATSLNVGATSGSTNVRNNLTVSGNLTVQGTTTIVDSTVTNIADPIITLGGGAGSTNPTADDNKDRGIAFKWVNDGGTTSTGFFGYDDSTGFLTYVQTATITNEVVSGTKGAMDVNLAGGSAMAIVYQSSLNNTGFLAAGTSGYILQTNGTASPPTWVSASGVSAGSATNADNIRTVAQTSNAVYYPTFVDSNNASNAYESVYTTGTFVINPATGNIGMGTANPQRPLHVVSIGTGTQGIAAFEAKASGFVVQDNGSQNGNVELVGYKQTSSTYHNILLRGSGPGLLIQTGTGNIGIEDTAPGTKLTVLGAGGSTLGTNGYLVHIGGTDSSVDPVRYMIGFSHGNNSTSTNVRAAIGGMVTTGGAGNLIFETGSSSGQVERMRITGSGGISFGTGGANYGSSGQLLQSNGNAAPTWVSASGIGAGSVSTVVQAGSASYYPTFVDSNNASATAENLYTTSSFQINPFTGNIQIGMTYNNYQPSSGGNHTLRLNALNTSSIGFHDSGSTIGNLKFSGDYGFEIGAYDGLYGPHNTILHGNVGIGTQSPSVKLHVVGNTYINGATTSTGRVTVNSTLDPVGRMAVYVPSTNTISLADSNSTAGLVIVGTGDRVRLQLGIGSSAIGPYGAWIQASYDNTGGSTGIEPLLLNPMGGNVGINTSSTTGLLTINNNSADGTSDYTKGIVFTDNSSGAGPWTHAGIWTVGASGWNGNLIFGTDGDSTNNTSGITERLRITSAGGISFGASGTAYGTSGQVLQSNGNAAPTWINQSSIAAGSAPLTNTYVGFGSAGNLLTGSANLTYASSILNVSYQNTFNATTPGFGTYGLHFNGQATNDYATGITFSAGSATAGNANAGIYSQGSGSYGTKLYFATTDSYAVGSKTRMMIDQAGNLGIGTTSPNRKLHVQSSGAAIQLFDASSNGGTGIFFAGASTLKNWFIGNQYNVSDVLEFTPSAAVGTTTIGSTPAVTMQSGGNVGIGVNSPEYLLDLGTLAEEYTTDKIRFNSYNGPAGGVSGYGGTAGGGTSLGSGIIWKPNYSGYSKRSAGILQIGEGNYFRAGLAFYTNNVTDGSTDWSEAMRIGSNGNVSIGAGSSPSLLNKFEVSGTAGQLFSVSDSTSGTIFAVSDVSGIPSVEVLDTGLVKLAQYNGQVAIGTGTVASSTATVSIYGMLYTMGTLGEIRASSEITAYFSSDARLKENIKLIENPITIIDQIRGVTFDWTEEHMARRGGEDGYFVRKHDIGVIAQEVQAVLPELVGTREDGYLAVKYEKMVPLLIEAIKEQQKTIDKQQESINNLILELANIKDTLASVNKN